MAALLLAACGGGAATNGGPATSTAPAVNAPAGLPQNWSSLAIQAATTALQHCAQANSLAPANCPQSAGGYGSVEEAHWTLLNQPLANAVAMPDPLCSRTPTCSRVDVYGLYQMDASYVVPDNSIRPYLSYDGGVAEATMTWDGTSFQDVVFARGKGADGTANVAPFARPSQASDSSIIAAVKAGFQDCVTQAFPPTNPNIPGCKFFPAYTHMRATSAQWVLNGDPTQGALVTFDTQHGNFHVNGSVDLTLNYVVTDNPGAAANGPHTTRTTLNYVATLSWDGSKIQFLNVSTI